MSVKALWDERELPSRGPKPALSAEQIARAAIAVADAEGLDAVSMQRIAREVNVTTMALYRYFSSKEELIDRMIDSAGGRLPPRISGAQGWRQRLVEWTRACSSIYRDHPWFLLHSGILWYSCRLCRSQRFSRRAHTLRHRNRRHAQERATCRLAELSVYREGAS